MDKQKPIFVIDWSIWDDTIGHHYEPKSNHTKKLMYTLTIYKQREDISLGVVTPELYKLVREAFGDRVAFSFLLENTVDIEASPFLSSDGESTIPYKVSLIALTIYKTIKDPQNVFLVTEDNVFAKMASDPAQTKGVKLTVVTSEQALTILADRKFKVF